MPSDFDEVMNMSVNPATSLYELEEYNRESIEEIRRMLRHDLYDSSEIVCDHITFLEHLLEKLQDIFNNESRAGDVAVHLKRDISDIGRLLNSLYDLKDNFFSAA